MFLNGVGDSACVLGKGIAWRDFGLIFTSYRSPLVLALVFGGWRFPLVLYICLFHVCVDSADILGKMHKSILTASY